MKKNGAQKSAATLAIASLVAGIGMSAGEAKAIDVPTTQILGSGLSLRQNLLRSNSKNAEPANNLYAEHKPEHKTGEGKCGEGKCGEKKEEAEKSGEGKCGEGKCGEKKDDAVATPSDDSKSGEGKCGEGKCGEKKE